MPVSEAIKKASEAKKNGNFLLFVSPLFGAVDKKYF